MRADSCRQRPLRTVGNTHGTDRPHKNNNTGLAMHRTMFDTPVVSALLRGLARLTLKLLGWKYVGGLPPGVHKCVMIAAPHTSNWDLPYTLLIALALDIKIYWMGKDTIFSFPFRRVMMWTGGIPVDRSKSNDMVAASAQQLKDAASLVLVVPPEGTRSKVTYWKTGFYWIAHTAGVPILLGYLDFAKKEGGIARAFTPTGDIEKDMVEIRAFYATVTGRKPQNFHDA
jgi:1-acyl-sn-glycerol-3-phosphate acyltransferase